MKQGKRRGARSRLRLHAPLSSYYRSPGNLSFIKLFSFYKKVLFFGCKETAYFVNTQEQFFFFLADSLDYRPTAASKREIYTVYLYLFFIFVTYIHNYII